MEGSYAVYLSAPTYIPTALLTQSNALYLENVLRDNLYNIDNVGTLMYLQRTKLAVFLSVVQITNVSAVEV